MAKFIEVDDVGLTVVAVGSDEQSLRREAEVTRRDACAR